MSAGFQTGLRFNNNVAAPSLLICVSSVAKIASPTNTPHPFVFNSCAFVVEKRKNKKASPFTRLALKFELTNTSFPWALVICHWTFSHLHFRRISTAG
jgi:hypothetical protein